MGIFYNALILSLGLWMIFKEKRFVPTLFGLIFLGILGATLFDIVGCSKMDIDEKVIHLSIIFLGIGILGYILRAVERYAIAQWGMLLLALIGVNFYIANPHTPIDDKVELDDDNELIVQVKHQNKENVLKDIRKLPFIEGIHLLSEVKHPEITQIDDYYLLDIQNEYCKNKAISKLTGIDGVVWIEPNEVMKLDVRPAKTQNIEWNTRTVNDQRAQDQWNMKVLNMDEYYDLFSQARYRPVKQSKLFILDSGVAGNHEDIVGNYRRASLGGQEQDIHGHGTHCAGIASAVTNNHLGIASMNPGRKWMTVTGIKVLNNQGRGTQANIVKGIIRAVDEGADVISMSLGGRSNQVREKTYLEAIDYATKHNVIIVAAAGNNAGDASKIVPGGLNKVITVSALNKSLNRAQFSNHITNTNYGIAAPGVSILSTWRNSKYATFDGTSMATPHVAGLIGIMRSLNPSLSTEKAYNILKSTGLSTPNELLTGPMIMPAKAVRKTVGQEL